MVVNLGGLECCRNRLLIPAKYYCTRLEMSQVVSWVIWAKSAFVSWYLSVSLANKNGLEVCLEAIQGDNPPY